MRNIGFWQLVILVVALMVLFGANKLPQLGKSVGEGIREFKKSMKDNEDDSDGEKKA